MKLVNPKFFASLIIVKVVLGALFLYWVELDPIFMERNAIAAEEIRENPVPWEEKGGAAAGSPRRRREENLDLNFLVTRSVELEKTEKYIKKRKAELLSIQEDINKKIKVLTQLRNEIRAEMSKKKAIEGQKIKHLIKAYTAMKPQKAARLIEKLDMELTIELLSKMKGNVVGGILTFVNVDTAAKISEALLKNDKS